MLIVLAINAAIDWIITARFLRNAPVASIIFPAQNRVKAKAADY
jgi:hypothetical protein